MNEHGVPAKPALKMLFDWLVFGQVIPAERCQVDMMKPSVALAVHRTALRQLVSRYNVAFPRVYGSVLTGKDTEESDLDLLVDAIVSTTLFTLVGLEHEAQKVLGVPVSVLTPDSYQSNFATAY